MVIFHSYVKLPEGILYQRIVAWFSNQFQLWCLCLHPTKDWLKLINTEFGICVAIGLILAFNRRSNTQPKHGGSSLRMPKSQILFWDCSENVWDDRHHYKPELPRPPWPRAFRWRRSIFRSSKVEHQNRFLPEWFGKILGEMNINKLLIRGF